MTLVAEVAESAPQRGKYCVCIKMNLTKVDQAGIGILVYLDGGPRNFTHLSGVSMRCRDSPGDRGWAVVLVEIDENVVVLVVAIAVF